MQVSRSTTMSAAPVTSGQRTAMSFDVDQRKHAVTVSVVDRNSGEVLQKMVYGRHAPTDQARLRAPRAGALVDVEA